MSLTSRGIVPVCLDIYPDSDWNTMLTRPVNQFLFDLHASTFPILPNNLPPIPLPLAAGWCVGPQSIPSPLD